MSLRITNLRQFERDLRHVSEKMHISANLAVKKIAFDIYKGVTEKTPVDTGYARASWNISPHRPNPSIETKFRFSDKSNCSHGRMGADNIQKQRVANKNKEADRWFITNNVPYIVYLEAGHSKQSAHMVTRTLNEVRANVAAILKGIE